MKSGTSTRSEAVLGPGNDPQTKKRGQGLAKLKGALVVAHFGGLLRFARLPIGLVAMVWLVSQNAVAGWPGLRNPFLV